MKCRRHPEIEMVTFAPEWPWPQCWYCAEERSLKLSALARNKRESEGIPE